MPDLIRDSNTGEIALGDMVEGVAYRSIPTSQTPAEYAQDMVWEAVGALPPSTGVTNARARVRLRQAGIVPFPEDVRQYRAQRQMSEADKRRHSDKITNQVRRTLQLDKKARKAVEG